MIENKEDISALKDAIITMHECGCAWVGCELVKELFPGKVAWEGVVHIYYLAEHPKAERCYAWCFEDEKGEKQHTTVLEIPPINSPETAVKAAREL